MPNITILEHEKIFFHCLSLIEKPECNNGKGGICTITILDIICLDDENMKEM